MWAVAKHVYGTVRGGPTESGQERGGGGPAASYPPRGIIRTPKTVEKTKKYKNLKNPYFKHKEYYLMGYKAVYQNDVNEKAPFLTN
jgi:hypothetical protein